MKYFLLVLLLVLLTFNTVFAGTLNQCVEMMRLHYVWLDQNKIKRAEKQLNTAARICAPVIKDPEQKELLTRTIENDKELVELYSRLIDKKIKNVL